MNIYHENDEIVVELDQYETDKLFLPFDGFGLLMADYINRKRVMINEHKKWFDQMIGKDWYHFSTYNDSAACRTLIFNNTSTLILFKLYFSQFF